jgi:hypothetical protein
MTTLSTSPSFALPSLATGSIGTRAQRQMLVGLTLFVMLAHWGLLGGLPSLLPNWQSDGRLAGSSQSTEAFVTRTIPIPVTEPPPAPPEPPAPLETVAEMPAPVVAPAPSFQDIAPIASIPPAASISAVPLATLAPLAPYGDDGDEAYGVAGLVDDGTPLALVIPNPARLLYDVKGRIKGIPYSANAELVWKHDGKNYDARLQVSLFFISRIQTSKGALTAQGLEPLRFGDKVRSEVAAHFEREKGKVSFSANTPDVALTAGAQDQLSVFIQLAALFGGNPNRLTPGVVLSFQAIGSRSAEDWIFKVGANETLKLPGGDVPTVKLVRDSLGENDAKAEIWLAPSQGYLPVRIRLTQGSSDFVDQLWRSTQIP